VSDVLFFLYLSFAPSRPDVANLSSPIITQLNVMIPVSDPRFMIASITTCAAVDYANLKFNPAMWVLFMNQLPLILSKLIRL